ncbi:YCF48-related protein [Algoriphagus halophytocola]|uniref:YCF48-related protein n=1 Tax=Algoriphagus halophytocola TaxID=2991499 RepID=A0ABY6MDT6_9BACT|nr:MULTISPECIES: YCF48-related protein [unclassified Algoriphagus]UZD21313.1 YCF48-related protein [Algoriphagus sp. TR-M5]WBL42524.1 YCF48-related protein [Algoriphagus sp. TR-M9]
MINRSLLALSILIALFSCNSNSAPSYSEQPLGWELKETPVKSSLRGLSAVTAEIVWASGSGGTWLKTLDGGETWEHGVIAGLDTVDFRSIHAFDAMNAVVVSAGQPAVIYKTSDGGASWGLKYQEEDELAFFDGIAFPSPDLGYVIGDPLEGKWTILKSANQGESWYPIDSLPVAEPGEAAFAASATSLVAAGNQIWLGTGGTASKMHYSSDGGSSWTQVKSPFVQGESSQGIFSLANLGSGQIVAVGGDYLDEPMREGVAANFLSSTGEWVPAQEAPGGYRSGVSYFSMQKWLIAVGPGGSDYSKDGGLTWEAFSGEGFHAVKMGQADGSVWASGSEGRVGKLLY